ncbi:Gfo/Idh/MocA family oxidoreductase [Promicromonospora sp. Populi]|uniref:Gfo/Idh/MocA family protein n=1 Tax=Promicromonospora sp. Populi TaxID=3239420 RepID=UPI0034E28D61
MTCRATAHVRGIVEAGSLGALYHATFINTLRRSRTGIDWLTESAWFRNPKISGGGVMMDWGPYDIAVLDEVFAPVRVTVNHAWTRSPVTGGPFREESLSVEQHVGASMTLELRDGTMVELTYERSAATHGEELSVVSVDGDLGSVTWSWLDWVPGGVRFTDADGDGSPRTVTRSFEEPPIGFHSRPLARTLEAIAEHAEPTAINATSLFTFSWLRAVVEAADAGSPVTVSRQDARTEAVR